MKSRANAARTISTEAVRRTDVARSSSSPLVPAARDPADLEDIRARGPERDPRVPLDDEHGETSSYSAADDPEELADTIGAVRARLVERRRRGRLHQRASERKHLLLAARERAGALAAARSSTEVLRDTRGPPSLRDRGAHTRRA